MLGLHYSLLGLPFNPEDEGCTFLQNVSKCSQTPDFPSQKIVSPIRSTAMKTTNLSTLFILIGRKKYVL
jgi:hypothetical protein